MESGVACIDTTRHRPAERGHVRDNQGWLAGAEKRTLMWLAHRMPRAVNSDHLSALGLLGMLAAGAAFAAGGTYPAALPLVIVALAVNWFGDSLDGTLARVRNMQRPNYGYYLDHVLDIIGVSLLFTGIAAGGFMTPLVAASLLCAYVAVMAETFLATYARGAFRMSFLGFGPTELRVVLSAGAIALLRTREAAPLGLGPFLLFDIGGVAATAGLLIAFFASSVRNARALYRAEPLGRASTAARSPATTSARAETGQRGNC
jgi:phosphatidylglycerophosphate synthase